MRRVAMRSSDEYVTTMSRLDELFWRVEDNPLDEVARREYESLISQDSPDSRAARLLRLERTLAESREDKFAVRELLDKLEENHKLRAPVAGESRRLEFLYDDPLWKSVMVRCFDLWLDYYSPKLALAVTNALRLQCGFKSASPPVAPLKIGEQGSALRVVECADGIREFVCRYEHRPRDPPDVSEDEMSLTIWPSWIERSEGTLPKE
jgi:hypothetical protein